MEYYSAIKRPKLLIPTTIWINLRVITSNENLNCVHYDFVYIKFWKMQMNLYKADHCLLEGRGEELERGTMILVVTYIFINSILLMISWIIIQFKTH